MNIQEFRQQYPQYEGVSDDELSKALHKKFYAQVPYETFAEKFGVTGPEKSYGKRVLEELPGTLEGSARMLAGVPGYIAGGLAGAATAPFEGVEAARAVQEGVTERLSPDTYLPPEGRTDSFNELMGAMNEKVGELGLAGGEALGGDVGGLFGQIGAQTALQLAPIPGARTMNRAIARPKELATQKRLEAEIKAREEALAVEQALKQKAFTEGATQRDWITEQQAVDMGPQRPGVEVPRGPQRDFWEQPRPPETGLEPSNRGGGEIAYEKTSPLDIEAKGKETPPVLRDDGILYEPVTDGVTRLLEQKREAETSRIFEARDAETRSGLPKAAEMEMAYERPEAPGRTFLEKLEEDLTRGDIKRVGPISSATSMGRQRGAVVTPQMLLDLRDRIEEAKKPGPEGLVDYKRWEELGAEYTRLFKEYQESGPKKPLGELRSFRKQRGAVGLDIGDRFRIKGRDEVHKILGIGKDDRGRTWLDVSETLSIPLTANIVPLKGPQGLVGPGRKQAGGWTPFAKREPTYADFLKELKYAKMDHIPDAVKRDLWESRHGKEIPKELPEPIPGRKVVEKIPGLDKETLENYYGKRTPEEVNADLIALHAAGGRDTRGGSWLTPPGYRAANHTLLRWVNSNINEKWDTATKWGEQLRIGRTFKGHKRAVDPDSTQGRWRALDDSSKTAVNIIGNHLSDKNLPFSPGIAREVLGRDLLPGEQRALEAIHKANAEVFDKVINDSRKAHNQPPLEPRNFYWSPATWSGDYMYFIRDAKTGEVVEPIGVSFRPTSFLGRAFNRDLAKALKRHGLKLDPNAVHRKTTPAEFDLAGMELLFERRGAIKDPRVQVARDTAESLLADFNMKRARSLERAGKPGYLGYGKDLKAVKEFERVWDSYIQAAVNARANLELGRFYRDFAGIEATSLFPKARDAAMGALDRAMGHQNKVVQAFDQGIADLLDRAGLPPSWWQKGINTANGASIRIVMGFMLASQILIQPLQPGFALAKSVQLRGRNIPGIHPAVGQVVAPLLVLGSLGKAVKDVFTRNNAYMKALAEEGTFSPSMKHEYAGFGEARFGERLPHKIGKVGIGDTIQQLVEKNAVRVPAGRLFYNVLKDIGVEGDALTRITKGLTDDYMVAFDNHKKAAWIANGGALGRLAGGLQSFTTTYLGQLFEYSRNTVTKGEFMPLVTFLGYSYLIAGALGMVGVKEADEAVLAINKFFNKDIPTATEWILTNAKSTAVRHGVLSAATETNIGVTGAAPSATYFSPPGVGLLGGIFKTVGLLLKHAFGGDSTAEERREAVRPLIPRILHGALENPGNKLSSALGTAHPGGEILDSSGNLVIKRDEFDKALRHLGTYSLKEAQGKREAYVLKQQESILAAKRSKFMDVASESLLDSRRLPPDFMEKAQKLKYRNTSELRQSLMRHLYDKHLSPKQRVMRGGTGSAKSVRAYQLYQQLQGEEERSRATQR